MEEFAPVNEPGTNHKRLHLVVIDCNPEDRDAFSGLKDDFELTIFEHVPTTEDEVIRRGEAADIIITLFHRTVFTPRVLQSLPRTRLIISRFAGLDNIDLDTAAEQGIYVANVPGGSGPAVAEFAFCRTAGRHPQTAGRGREDENRSAVLGGSPRHRTVQKDHGNRRLRQHRPARRPHRARIRHASTGMEPQSTAGAHVDAWSGERFPGLLAARSGCRLVAHGPRAGNGKLAQSRKTGVDEARSGPGQHRPRRSGGRRGAVAFLENGSHRRPRFWTSSRPSRRRPTTRCCNWTTSSRRLTWRGSPERPFSDNSKRRVASRGSS